MNAQLLNLARVPRTISQDLDPLVPEGHPWSPIGAWVTLAGVLAMIGVGALAFLGIASWRLLAPGALMIGVGHAIRRLVRTKSLEAGRERLARLPFSFVTVVQANSDLYDPEELAFGPAVIAYASGPAALDPTSMLTLAREVASLRGRTSGDPERDKIGALLDDEESHFSLTLPSSLTGSSQVIIQTTMIDPDHIPGGHLHDESVLAGFLDERGRLFKLIPARAYQ
jgi:hypothetical protein